jgi:hypothetical protein
MNGRLNHVRAALAGIEVDAETEALADEMFEVVPSEQDLHTNPVFPDSTDDGSGPAPEPGTAGGYRSGSTSRAPRFRRH